MNAILYYIIVKPLSLMPLWYNYLVSDGLYVLIWWVAGYRKKIIQSNLLIAFPNKAEAERKKIEKKFRRHFTDLIAEGVRNFSMSKKELQKRVTVSNPELMRQLYDEGRSVVLLSSHLNNWELLVTIQDQLFLHKAVGIGMPMTNKFWDRKVNKIRERFGMKVVNPGNYKSEIELLLKEGKKICTLVLGDQSPGGTERSYWKLFCGRETAFHFGGEFIAHHFNHTVVYANMKKKSRGMYEINLELISLEPSYETYGAITDKYIGFLHRDIVKWPEHWLWSHKRWKHDPPENLEAVKERHKEQFEQRFIKV